MLSFPVLAAGVVGTLLGATVMRFWHRAVPVMPVALARLAVDTARSDLAEAQVDRDLAHRDAVEAQDAVATMAAQRDEARAAMALCAQELSNERRTLAQARRDLELAEEDLALAHVETRQAQLGLVLLVAENERLRDDPPWMQQPIAAFAPAELGGNVVALDPWTGFR